MPRSWDVPAEPGPDVQRVRDVDGDIWYRGERGWYLTRFGVEQYHRSPGSSWSEIFQHAPLTEVRSEELPDE